MVSVCAGSAIYHPIGAFFVGGIAAAIFVYGFHFETEILKIDDVLGVVVLHGAVGSWGGIATGIFGQKAFGGIGGVSFISQIIGTFSAIIFALISGFVVYFTINKIVGFRLSEMEEFKGSDLSIHSAEAYPESDIY